MRALIRFAIESRAIFMSHFADLRTRQILRIELRLSENADVCGVAVLHQ
jgi:hypothetical protein